MARRKIVRTRATPKAVKTTLTLPPIPAPAAVTAGAPHWPLQSQCDDFYGNPRMVGHPDQASPVWKAANLVLVHCPWAINGGSGAGAFTLHRKCADSAARVLNRIWDAVGRNQDQINRLHYNVFDGSFNYRNKRGGGSLSMHVYGVAIDWDAKDNPFHDRHHEFTDDSLLIVKFKEEGWVWGGDWSPGSVDAMHVQASRVHP